MKVIDILNKIANGEEVKFKILSVNAIYRYDKDYQLYCETSDEICEWGIDYRWLNEEVEIIKDKKIPEKLGCCSTDLLEADMIEKINQIIDYLEDKQC